MSKVPFSRVLVYLDGSEGSLNALMYGIMIAKSMNVQLHAAYIINTKALVELVRSHVFIDEEKNDYLNDLREDASRHLRHAKKLATSKDIDITVYSVEGSPHIEILNYIRDNDIDLLLLGSVNKIRSRREELASENERMLRTVQCPVLILKDDMDLWSSFEEV